MSNHFLENLVINAQKIPATNSGIKISEFSIFINLLKTKNNEKKWLHERDLNMYTIIVLEFVVLDRFCWNYNYFGTYLPTLPNKIIYGYNPWPCGFSYLHLWSIYYLFTVHFKFSFLSNATFRCNIHATFCFLTFHSDLKSGQNKKE